MRSDLLFKYRIRAGGVEGEVSHLKKSRVSREMTMTELQQLPSERNRAKSSANGANPWEMPTTVKQVFPRNSGWSS